jgi:nucleoside phosphorylase
LKRVPLRGFTAPITFCAQLRGLAAPAVCAALLALGALLGGCACLNAAPDQEPAIDIAILTVLEPEYAAAAARVENPSPVEGAEARRYRWMRGEIESNRYDRPFQLVVGITGNKGEVAGALATRAAIARWNPRHVLLVGIAGGVGGSASVGDVVLPDPVWSYEVGHLAHNFTPKLGWKYPPDPALLRAALAVQSEWVHGIRAEPPGERPASRVVSGPIASGNKVIESKSSVLYSDLVRAEPGFIAVEMEAAGAAAAVVDATDEGYEVGFMMVRAVSDVIRAKPEGEVVEGQSYVDPERESWRVYASDVAAAFAEPLIRDHWPVPPR